MMLKRIVVGLDESDASRSAARWCAGLASATGARVTAVHGLGKLPEIFIGTPAAVASGLGLSGSEFHSWRAKQRSCLECWCAPLREAGIDHRGELVDLAPNALASILIALGDGLILHAALDPAAFQWRNVATVLVMLLEGLRR